MKKLICIILALCMLACFGGCKSADKTGSSFNAEEVLPSLENKTGSLSLLYSYSDTFNPYTAKTEANRNLANLLFDSLVKTDNGFNAEYVLAKSVKTVKKTCTVKLRDATFTDGSAVTADDVIYSYNLAKESDVYKHNFYEVKSVSANDSKTVIFELTRYDRYFINLLDFPILKKGTSGKSDADGKEISPIGCGRYYIAEDSASFKLNPDYYGKKGSVKTIKLTNSPDSASTSHYVEVGATSLYYNDDGDIVRMSGKKTEVNLNRFIYIGINSSYGTLETKEMRYAISSALDRTAICQSAYYNNAVSAKGFFNPSFEATQAVQTIESKPNSKITVENLSKIGYNIVNSDGYYANSSGNHPTFTLLVNSENSSRVAAAKLIAAQCKTAGIQINVVKCTYAQYVERLKKGSFQLYLGEVQILDNMDMGELVTSGGSAAFGVNNKSDKPKDDKSQASEKPDESEKDKPKAKKSESERILDAFYLGECSIGDVAGTLLTEMPQIPICYINGVLFYDSAIKGEVTASSSDIYLSIQDYRF